MTYDDSLSSATQDAGAPLTFDLRELVWGIESEVAQITALSRRIDERVRVVNAVRHEAVARLLALDELVDAADDDDLRSWLDTVTQAVLPQVVERFPDRLYTD